MFAPRLRRVTVLTQIFNSDPAVKQLILSIDERSRFIILDLDDTHLLISPERIDWLRTELEMEVSDPHAL